VHGTTGYEWLNAITQVLVDGKGLEPLDEVWRQISNLPPGSPRLEGGQAQGSGDLAHQRIHGADAPARADRRGHYSTRDFSADSLRQALELYVLHFPIYRTYLTAAGPTAHDRALISQTIERARAEWFAADDGHLRILARYANDGPDQAGQASAQRAARAPLCAEGAAVYRSPDGEGARGYRVLSLPPPAGTQRGRRRSVSQSAFHRRLSRGDDKSAPTSGRTA
jgi:(1->4)-alpha-D-glucan 1-alpha-D-glucosylmutase